jgi:hypothetical protein
MYRGPILGSALALLLAAAFATPTVAATSPSVAQTADAQARSN